MTVRDSIIHRRILSPHKMTAPHRLVAVLTLAAATSTAALAGPPADADILALMKAHCIMCHAADPTHPAFAKAPAGVLLETLPQVAANADRIMTQVVVTGAMPLGNETGMTDEERSRVAAWIRSRDR
jgi:uncharacterized membrane protein